MNRSSSGLKLTKANEIFGNFKLAEGLSQPTVDSYFYVLRIWLDRVGDLDKCKIEPSSITDNLAWLRTEYKPVWLNGLTHPLSPKKNPEFLGHPMCYFKWPNYELHTLSDNISSQFKLADCFATCYLKLNIIIGRGIGIDTAVPPYDGSGRHTSTLPNNRNALIKV